MEMTPYADMFSSKPKKDSRKKEIKGYKVSLTDDEVIELRTNWERNGWDMKQLMARFPQVNRHYINKIIRYEVRSSILPPYYAKREK